MAARGGPSSTVWLPFYPICFEMGETAGGAMPDIAAAQVAAALFRAMNARDPAAFGALLADGAVFHFPGTAPLAGAARIEKFVKILLFKYPVLAFEPRRVIADGRCAAVEWSNAGTGRDGAPYRNAGVTVIELDDAGRVVYLSDTFKDTSFSVR
jgi:ketosteroid isomerase-like protein